MPDQIDQYALLTPPPKTKQIRLVIRSLNSHMASSVETNYILCWEKKMRLNNHSQDLLNSRVVSLKFAVLFSLYSR